MFVGDAVSAYNGDLRLEELGGEKGVVSEDCEDLVSITEATWVRAAAFNAPRVSSLTSVVIISGMLTFGGRYVIE